jgi:transposase InsO family protein
MRPDLHPHLGRVRLPRPGHRCVLPAPGRLGADHPFAHRPAVGSVRDGGLGAQRTLGSTPRRVDSSQRRGQYTAIRYTDTLAGVGALPSIGSVGDSYDNALAESTIGQIKTELVHRRGPWRTVEQLEYALFEYIDWWNHRRLHGEIGMRTPTETEAAYYAQAALLTEAGTQ